MSFEPIRRLNVWRTLGTGEKVALGALAQNRQGVFFQYQAEYLARFGAAGNVSPFRLKADTSLQAAPAEPHSGLHGVFADSLPDGWGLLLQDRAFRQQGILPGQVTAMDRLAFVGARGSGALSYEPELFHGKQQPSEHPLAELGLKAQAIFDGQTQEILQALILAGSSAGARPKAQLYFAPGSTETCRTLPKPGDEAWLIKFTSRRFPLGHEEGRCEAAYLQIAFGLALQPAEWRLLEAPPQSGARQWLALKRFDCQDQGRLHLLSAAGLLDADFRAPSLDYQDLIKVAGHLCRSPEAAQLLFRRAIFNLFAANEDDHAKNWAFVLDDLGQWQPAPFYDLTFSPHPYREHTTAYAGFGKAPPLARVQQLARSAGYANWPEAREAIARILDGLMGFAAIAKDLEIPPDVIAQIQAVLKQRYQENRGLLAR